MDIRVLPAVPRGNAKDDGRHHAVSAARERRASHGHSSHDHDVLPPCALTFYDFEGHEECYSLQSHVLYTDIICVLTVNLHEVATDLRAARRGAVWWLDAVSKSADRGSALNVVLLGTYMDKVRWGECGTRTFGGAAGSAVGPHLCRLW